MEATLKLCNIDCLLTSHTPIECSDKCTLCATTEGCWVDASYGDSDDVECYNTCYQSCGDYWLAASDLCNCSGHNACVLGCIDNCDDSILKTCNVDCVAKTT
jgi:hypothetical protein